MKKIIKAFDSIEINISSVLVVVMSLAVLTQLVSREIFGKSLLFTEEIAKYAYIWVVFFCISMGEKDREHFYVNIFVQFVKGRANLVLYSIEYFAGCIVFAYLLYWSIKFYIFESVILSPALEISMTTVAGAVVVGMALALIRRTKKLIISIADIINYSKEKVVKV
jgi:TRAP-type C4-dicarboxylate transport system permease small subunit